MQHKKVLIATIIIGIALVLSYRLSHIYNPALFVYAIGTSTVLGIVLTLSVKYKTVPVDPSYQPKVSLVLAVFNEPLDVLKKVIDSTLNAKYPEGKKEIIVVDDGSANDSVKQLSKLVDPEKVKIIFFEKNRGNKYARMEGIRAATGEILVFLDSDTTLDENALLNVVAPFKNPKVGSVSGHLTVENWSKNILTKFQEVWYFIGFRVYRGAESEIGMVSCCAGAFSAHRRAAITPQVEYEWLYGKFLGLEVTAGVDRAITNLIIREGYEAVYQMDAVAQTEVPETTKKFLKQQVRWTKSWIRETLYMMTFAYKRRSKSIFFYLSTLVHFVNYGFLVFMLYLCPFLIQDGWIGTVFYLFSLSLLGLLYALYARKHTHAWTSRVTFQLIFSIISVPIFVYSLFTLKDKKWGTR
ncbi:MAG: glycosyltransferase [Candidatus Bathyarchaeota archaeon]|nr:glycosyltransferase [Candidatus Bathyarchaeota archaeon]